MIEALSLSFIAEETTRDLANRFRSYEKEHYFYAELAKSADVRVLAISTSTEGRMDFSWDLKIQEPTYSEDCPIKRRK